MRSLSRIDIGDILVRGGEERVALLRYCVMSVTMEPLFVFLAQEYRFRPTHVAALALYDVFCAPAAPARIQAPGALPPMNLKLLAAAQSIRQQWARLESPLEPDDAATVSITAPARNLFDLVTDSVRSDRAGRFARVGDQYDPRLAPHQNLPGGRMSATQRHFVERIWRPIARPRLVVAGFWQIASIE
jgi:hypothetical protein